jgi:hypothetical protein
MVRPTRPIKLLLAAGLSLAALPALAQFGSIFRDEPPRPPGTIPDQRSAPPNFPPPAQRDFPVRRAPEPLPLPTTLPPPGGPAGPALPSINPPTDSRGRAIQSQPLPPPPGGTAAPAQAARPAQPDSGQQATAPAETPPPVEEVVVPPPPQRIVNPTAVFAGLDKITGRITSFDVAIDETVQFGALRVTPHVCYSRPPTETPRTDAFIDVDEVTLQGEVRRIFTGWMFAASPGLHAVEHPIYDIWLTECKGGSLAVADTGAGNAPQQPATPAPRAQRRR